MRGDLGTGEALCLTCVLSTFLSFSQNLSLRSYSELEVKERYNISPTTTIHLIHDDDREFSEMTSSMNSDASNDMDLVKHHDGRISTSLC